MHACMGEGVSPPSPYILRLLLSFSIFMHVPAADRKNARVLDGKDGTIELLHKVGVDGWPF